MLLAKVSALLILSVLFIRAAPEIADEKRQRYFLELKTIPSSSNKISTEESKLKSEQTKKNAEKNRQKFPDSLLELLQNSGLLFHSKFQNNSTKIVDFTEQTKQKRTEEEGKLKSKQTNKIAEGNGLKIPISLLELLQNSGLLFHSKFQNNSTKIEDIKKEQTVSEMKINSNNIELLENLLEVQRQRVKDASLQVKTSEMEKGRNSRKLFIRSSSVPQTREFRKLNIYELAENVSDNENEAQFHKIISQQQNQPMQDGDTKLYISRSDERAIGQQPRNLPTIQKLEGTLVLKEHDIHNKFSTAKGQYDEPVIKYPSNVFRSDLIKTTQLIDDNVQGFSINPDQSISVSEQSEIEQSVKNPTVSNMHPNVQYATTSITQPINVVADNQMFTSVANPKETFNPEEITLNVNLQSKVLASGELQPNQVAGDQMVQYVVSIPNLDKSQDNGSSDSQDYGSVKESPAQLQKIQSNEQNGQIKLSNPEIPVMMEFHSDKSNQGQLVQILTPSMTQSFNKASENNEGSSDDASKQYSSTSEQTGSIKFVKADMPVVIEVQSEENVSNQNVQYVTTSVSSPQAIETFVSDKGDIITITEEQNFSSTGNTDIIELIETKIPVVMELQPDTISQDQPTQYVTTSKDQTQSVNSVSGVIQETFSPDSDNSGTIEIIQAEMPVLVELQPTNMLPDQGGQHGTTFGKQPEPSNGFTVDNIRSSITVQEQDSSSSDQNSNVELIQSDIPVVIELQPDKQPQDQVIQYVTTSITQPVNDKTKGSVVTYEQDVQLPNNGHTEAAGPVNPEFPVVFELRPETKVNDYIFKYATSVLEPENEPEEIPELFVTRRNFIFKPDRFVLTTSLGNQIEVHKRYSVDDNGSGSNVNQFTTVTNAETNGQFAAQHTDNYENQGNIITVTEIDEPTDGSFTIQTAEQQPPRNYRINSKYRRGPLWWVNTNTGFAPIGGDIAANGYVFSVDGGDANPDPSNLFSEEDDMSKK